jgi:lipopolysaccharide transport system ATP-binding protein
MLSNMSLSFSVDKLSKKYYIRHQGSDSIENYFTLRDMLSSGYKKLGQKLLKPFSRSTDQTVDTFSTEEFWALKDISFDIQGGERLGIIGCNGAGKSTLLKILSRITEPTSGTVTINGRVSSLLEVGTGFHPELTGRENIFLNGAILGMKKTEIKSKFDEIVSFSEIETFLDTPVKRYSSGMYVRLAFSVAAHLEPEILILDEVLAVGDIAFQSKCLNKIKSIGGEGRTIIFVSHSVGSVSNLCTRAILLEKGVLVADGLPDAVIDRYLSSVNQVF